MMLRVELEAHRTVNPLGLSRDRSRSVPYHSISTLSLYPGVSIRKYK